MTGADGRAAPIADGRAAADIAADAAADTFPVAQPIGIDGRADAVFDACWSLELASRVTC